MAKNEQAEIKKETEAKGKHEGEKKLDVNELIEKGKLGELSTSDLDEAMESMDFDMESLEKLYEAFEDNGVSLPGDISNTEMSEIEHEVERFGGGENMEKILEQEGLSIDDPVRMYLKEIGKVPLLNTDREKDLAERMADGDEEAKTELVEANLRLVV
ncbi:MAG: RNA polymerase sigma factor RpoD, partial [Clostridia bacterium]|nr:RNA polymerase sigma factor RpoD [Clostridia bacterium]